MPVAPIRSDGRIGAFLELPAVRQIGQRVVGRQVVVLLGLPTDAPRRPRDQLVQPDVEQAESQRECDVELAGVLGDRCGDRRVRQVDLERAHDLALGRVELALLVDPQGDVHRQQLAEVALLELLGGRQIGDLGRHPAREAVLEQVVAGEPASPQLGVVGVDEPVLAVPDLQTDDAVARQRGGERRVQVRDTLGCEGHEVAGQVRRLQHGDDADASRDLGGADGVGDGSLLHGGAQHGGQHHAEHDDQDQAQPREPGEQARSIIATRSPQCSIVATRSPQCSIISTRSPQCHVLRSAIGPHD